MRSFLGNHRGQFLPPLAPLFQAVAGLVLVAVFIGRGASEPVTPRAPRSPAPPRYFTLGAAGDADHPLDFPHLRDTETGADMPCPVGVGKNISHLDCSPWRDGEGQYHLVGLSPGGADDFYELVLYSFPAGRVLGRIDLDVPPHGKPCWSPDRSDRCLIARYDQVLYLCDMPEAGADRSRHRARPQKVKWRVDPPGVGSCLVQDPCWAAVGALDGRVLVSLDYLQDPSQTVRSVRLWWLKLSPDGGAIVAAERAVVPSKDDLDQAPSEERLPSVGTARDGTPLLAYLTQGRGEQGWTLRVMPVAPAASGRGPQVLVSAGRMLATGCGLAVTPAFSSDGRWVFASRWDGGKQRVQRFAVDVAADAIPAASTFRR
jgi:hypothetical protein